MQRRTTDLGRRRETAKERRGFEKVRRAERDYARGLRNIARHIGELVAGMDLEDPDEVRKLEEMLRDYADVIDPWARIHAQRMLADVARRDEAVWAGLAKDMNRALRDEILQAPTGKLLKELEELQVTLIKSLPLEAAQRVQHFAMEALANSSRAKDFVEEIARTGQVTLGRANMIARTEVARASSNLVQARALHVGSDGYVWETSRDSDVRESHRKMQGKFVRWSEPPILDNLQGHAGGLPNCRCWPRPIIPEEA